MAKANLRLKFTFVALLLISVVIYQNCGDGTYRLVENPLVDDPTTLGNKALKIRQNHCAGCHQIPNVAAEPSKILDDQFLIDNHWIKPGEPENSQFYTSLFSGMPKNQPRLSDEDIDVIRRWILILGENGKPPAVLTISEDPQFDFGSVTTGSTSEHSFTITNSGERSASGLSSPSIAAPFRFKGGSFPGVGGTCLPMLAPTASCSVIVEFTPTTSGTFTGVLDLGYHDGVQAQSAQRNLRGSGTGISIASLTFLDGASYNFGTVNVGAPAAEKTFSIRNTGNVPATNVVTSGLSAPFTFKGGTFPGSGGNCSSNISAGATCTVVVTFTPTAGGSQMDDLTLTYYNGTSSQTASIQLNGNGLVASAVTYTQVRNILSTSCQSCHDSNWGSTYAALMAFKRPTSASTPSIIGGNANSRFIKRITGSELGPQMGTGSYGNLSAADRDKIVAWIIAGAQNDSVAAPAVLALNNGPTHNFGSATTGSVLSATFTLSNSGGQPASSISGLALTAPFRYRGASFPGTGGTCTSTLANGSSCTIVLEFAPTSVTSFTGTLRVSYNDGTTTRTVQRALAGTGTGIPVASLAISHQPSYSFGSIAVSSFAERAFTITNSGAGAATNISGTLAAPFVFKGGTFPGTGGTCSSSVSLAAAGTCTVVVQFRPTLSGTFNGSLAINYNNGTSAQSTSRALTGVGAGGGSPIYFSQVRAILSTSCASCHSSEWGTSYAQLLAFKRPSSQLTSAIIPSNLNSRFVKKISGTELGDQMGVGAYGSLSAADRQTIVDWIANGAPNDPAGTITQDYRPLVGDRYYIASVLRKVYGEDQNMVLRYVNNISMRADLFAGPCHMQDATLVGGNAREKAIPFADRCFGANSEEARLSAEVVPITSSVSEAVRMSTCMRIANSIDTTTVALTGAGLTEASPFDDANVTKAYSHFYPGASPSAQAVARLKALGSEALTSTSVIPQTGRTRQLEGWRYVFMAVCMSPGWQAP